MGIQILMLLIFFVDQTQPVDTIPFSYIELFEEIRQTRNPNKVVSLLHTVEAEELSDSLQTLYHYYAGSALGQLGQLDSGLILLNKAAFSTTIQDPDFKIRLQLAKGNVYYAKGFFNLAIDHYQQAIEVNRDHGDREWDAFILGNIAGIYYQLEDYNRALQYAKDADITAKEIGFKSPRAHMKIGNYLQQIGENESAIVSLDETLNMLSDGEDSIALGVCLSLIGKVHYNLQHFNTAEEFLGKADLVFDKLDYQDITHLLYRARLALSQGSLTKAEGYLDWAQEVAIAQSSAQLLLEIVSLKKDIATIKGDWKKSYNLSEQALVLSDSIKSQKTINTIYELEAIYQAEQKEAEIMQLTAQNSIKDLKAKQDAQTRLILIIVALALVIIAILFYSRFRSKAKTNALLDAKNRELATLNQTKDRLFSIISHDLKSPLSSFHLITKSLADNLEVLDTSQLKEYLLSLQESSANIKEMMDNLLKWALSQTDQLAGKMEPVEVNAIVDDVIKQMALASATKSIKIEKKTQEDLKIQGDASFIEIVLRNLLSNSLKFSPTGKTIYVETHSTGEKAILRVADEGVGMEQSQINQLLAGEIIGQEIKNSTEKGTGLGVTLVNELVKKMNGRLSVVTEKGMGTTFEISFDKAA